MRSLKCARFFLARVWPLLLLCLGLYFAITCALPTLAYITKAAGYGVGGSFFLLYAVIFVFVIGTTLYKNLWNNLLLYGNTRRDIYYGMLLGFAAISTVLALAAWPADAAAKAVHRALGLSVFDLTAALYPGAGAGALLLLNFGALFCAAGLSLLLGALIYKFGRIAYVVFWMSFTLLPSLVMPFFKAETGSIAALAALRAFIGANGHPVAGFLYLALAGLVLSLGSLALSVRQPQRA